MFARESSTRDLEAFIKLARGYTGHLYCQSRSKLPIQPGKHGCQWDLYLLISFHLQHHRVPATVVGIYGTLSQLPLHSGHPFRFSSARPAFANGNTLASRSNGSPSRPNSHNVTPSLCDCKNTTYHSRSTSHVCISKLTRFDCGIRSSSVEVQIILQPVVDIKFKERLGGLMVVIGMLGRGRWTIQIRLILMSRVTSTPK
ncbi:hypothetical protein PILCRDRAFT_430009 [Piloderma croceum F 1598]|uniref:Uncharacterized protein n=1 Tax=Piloderma croceum (strain F 1598) TaxID=765440 RepID=A0A0C3C269_PILCF|nr:hypothetical protein PILCRDRAFT_430009 [Piloderma croceum F 1598]